MKRIQVIPEEQLIIGLGEDLLPVYKAMERAYYNCRSDYSPRYLSTPKLPRKKMYGIFIDVDGMFNIVTADFVLWYLIESGKEKRK